MAELQAGIVYAGTPGVPYTANNKNGKPYIVIPVDVTHQALNGAWVNTPPKDDGKQPKAWVKWYMTDSAWPYTEQKLRALQFNGNFVNPAVGVPSMVIIGEQNGQYINWDTPKEGGGEHEAVDDKTLAVLTARYGQNNPKPQADSAPPPPPPPVDNGPQDAPDPAIAGAPGDDPGEEDFPF